MATINEVQSIKQYKTKNKKAKQKQIKKKYERPK
jgi:hypothetical protein